MIRNNKDFIIAIENKWPNHYDCSCTNYINARTDVEIICKKHGLFKINPYNGLRKKHICPICNKENSIYSRKLNTNDWKKRFVYLHGDKYDYSLINDENIDEFKVPIICKTHGIFYQNKYNHGIKGQGCKKCNATSHHGSKNNCINQPKSLRNQSGKSNKMVTKVTFDIFKQRSIEKYGNVTDFENVKFVDRCTPIELKCIKHNYTFFISPKNHFDHYGCPICAKENRAKSRTKSYNEWYKECINKHGNKYDYSLVKYNTGNSIVDIVCPKHGLFKMKAWNHANGHGCPKCIESHLEREIRVLCENHNINYDYQKMFPWFKQYRLDFFIPEKNIGIECQGEQHFEFCEYFHGDKNGFVKRQHYDKEKFELCKEHGIKIIYYTSKKHKGCTTKISNILKQIK